MIEAINLMKKGKLRESERKFIKGLKKDPRNVDILCYLSAIYQQTHRHDQAENALKRAMSINPNSAVLNLYANIRTEKGDFEGAEKLIRKALKTGENKVASLINLSKLNQADKDIASQLEECLFEDIDNEKFIAACYCLGDHYEKAGDFKKALYYYKTANSRKKYTAPQYSHEAHENYLESIKKIFTKKYKPVGHQSSAPIFIVGMPRSGTTLIEQIISQHSEVTAVGELSYLPKLTHNYDFGDNLQKLGKSYLEQVGIDGKFTDKLPHNYHYIRLINVMFPNAKIIHVKRNRDDCIWSCFKNNFTYGVTYSNSLDDLNQYYDRYEAFMKHYKWCEFYTADYEKLVKFPEKEIPKLIEYLGFDFEEACLYPENNGRAVRTASVSQVREKINSKSIGIFDNYRHLL